METGLVRLEKGRRRAAAGRKKRKGRRGRETTYNHGDSKGVVILYTEISFSTAIRVLFPNTKMVIFLYILVNNHRSNVCVGVRLGQDNMINKCKNLPYAFPPPPNKQKGLPRYSGAAKEKGEARGE